LTSTCGQACNSSPAMACGVCCWACKLNSAL
jgi:hypothetical protein